MPKFNLKKFNLKKEYYLYIIIIILAVIVVGISSFFLIEKTSQPKVSYQPPSSKPMDEKLKPGTVGETEVLVGELPPAMFNTTGTIEEVTDRGLKVQGSGSNFNDRQVRTLTIVFINSTLTTKLGEKIRYQGLEGLEYLKAGMNVLIEGDENIRGKVQFQARYITIL